MEETSDLLSIPIQNTGLPLRVTNILRMHGIHTIGEMLEHHRAELPHMQGLGKSSLAAVDEFITSNGLVWKRR